MAATQARDINEAYTAQEPDHSVVNSTDNKHGYLASDEEKKSLQEEEAEVLDNKFPFPPLKGIPDEEQQLSIRALVIGICLGAIVSASNIYLGLKTGWTFGASLFGGILGFAIIKPLSRVAPRFLGGGYFGPKVCALLSGTTTARARDS